MKTCLVKWFLIAACGQWADLKVCPAQHRAPHTAPSKKCVIIIDLVNLFPSALNKCAFQLLRWENDKMLCFFRDSWFYLSLCIPWLILGNLFQLTECWFPLSAESTMYKAGTAIVSYNISAVFLSCTASKEFFLSCHTFWRVCYHHPVWWDQQSEGDENCKCNHTSSINV